MTEDVTTHLQEDCEVISNSLYAANRYLLVIKSSAIAPRVKPGHNIYLRIPGMEGRAVKTHFPIFDVDLESGTISILYYIVGYATACMARVQPGHLLYSEGPLDAEWPVDTGAKKVLLYGNDMGPARLCLLAKELSAAGVRVDAVLEGETLGAVAAFQRQLEPLGVNVLIATHDGLGDLFGNLGRRARVAEMMEEETYDYMVACGSEDILDEYATVCFVMNLPYYSAVDFWNPVTR